MRLRPAHPDPRRLRLASGTPCSAFPTSQAEGMALVITLILLAVITFMAIAFLVLTSNQRSAAVTQMDQMQAQLATETALQRAIAGVSADVMASSNEFNFDLRPSTNFINGAGFFTGLPAGGNPYTNVNYDYTAGAAHSPLTPAQALQNLTNLILDPRPPVFVTNRLTGGYDFRYYLDLNRNGRFEPTGPSIVTNVLGQPLIISNLMVTNFLVGDPQWIGVLEYPDRPHGPNNRFLYRYAYLVLPAGKTLDLNHIHNQAKLLGPGVDGFMRNEGVGPWEMNLAASLIDLNTNLWPYPPNSGSMYNVLNFNPALSSIGNAYEDALALVSYRYGFNYTLNQQSVANLFGAVGSAAFSSDHIDAYSAGPLMTNWYLPPGPDPDAAAVAKPWCGADNTNHFFSHQDIFDGLKVNHWGVPGGGFNDRMVTASTNIDTYNRYTYYRLLSSVGTDSAPEPPDTINLNYDNLVRKNPLGVASATNFYPWDPAAFFTNAAARLLASAGYVVGPTPVGNTFVPTNMLVRNRQGGLNLQIQVYPTNYYTPSVHRLLQMAANIYDSTTNRPAANGTTSSNGFPTIFRPIFRESPTVPPMVYIVGFREVVDDSLAFAATAPTNVVLETGLNAGVIPVVGTPVDPVEKNEPLIAGFPLVVGVKKGFPNFNEFALQTQVAVTRKLEFSRPTTNAPVDTVKQMYLFTVTNHAVGLEAWNSYSNAYPRPLEMIVAGDTSLFVTTNFISTNRLWGQVRSNLFAPYMYHGEFTADARIDRLNWPGWAGSSATFTNQKQSFLVPIHPDTNNYVPLTNSTYSFDDNNFICPYLTNFDNPHIQKNQFPVPHWFVTVRVHLHYILVDTDARRIVDYVNLSSSYPNDDTPCDITTTLMQDAPVREMVSQRYAPDDGAGCMWITNRGGTNVDSTPTFGIRNQIAASLGTNDNNLSAYINQYYRDGYTFWDDVNYFRFNLDPTNWTPDKADSRGRSGPFSVSAKFNAPYQPTRYIFIVTSWQANDPLVHYTVGDLSVPIRGFQADNPPMFAGKTNVFAFLGGYDPASPFVGSRREINIGTLPINPRYSPWGLDTVTAGGTNAFAVALKDPMPDPSGQGRTDDYEFLTNKFPNVGWIGRVHRGTPWQTAYLKYPPTDFAAWTNWCGNGLVMTNFGQLPTSMVPLTTGYFDAALSLPIQDRALLDIFTASLDTSSGLGKLSINQTNLAAWSAVFSGLLTLSNNLDDTVVQAAHPVPPQFTAVDIQPAGRYDPYDPAVPLPPVVRLVNAINAARATNNPARRVFDHLGDILSVPELTVGAGSGQGIHPQYVGTYPNGYWAAASPFLNLGPPPAASHGGLAQVVAPSDQQQKALNDAAYERIPQQILGLIKCDHTPRFVVYCYGQTLKPAEHSVLTSGGPGVFGLCTNYQVTAEMATRAVVRLDGAPNNPQPVIESFNVLPPD